MHLEMKSRCGSCGSSLSPSGEAFICSYECTLCPACASDAHGVCPNCGGELIRRPRRTMPGGLQLTSDPPSDSRSSATKPWVIWVVSLGVWTFIALAAAGSIYELYRTMGTPMSFLSTL